MYICIGTHRINVDQIQTYSFEQKAGVITIFFTDSSLMRFDCKEYDLDILILELDRVCNPKVLKGKLMRKKKKKETLNRCETCVYYQEGKQPDGILWQSCDHDFECANIYAFQYKAKDEK